MTLEEAIKEIEAMQSKTASTEEAFAYNEVLGILAQVAQPELSEDDRAVIWLMKENPGFTIFWWESEWHQEHHVLSNPINPAEEARKLGWEG